MRYIDIQKPLLKNGLQCGIIYKITNNINGKCYIGQTINPKQRFNKHCKSNKYYIDKSIQKYGIDNFTYEVLYITDYLCKDDLLTVLNEKEIYYINLYDSFNNGYNQTLGGQGTLGHPCSQKTKDFLKIYNKNRVLSEDTIQKHRDNAYKNYDKRYTEDARNKMSMANRYIQKSEASIELQKHTKQKNTYKTNSVKINLYDNGQLILIFNSRKECFEYFKNDISENTIKYMLSGKTKHFRKFPTYKLEYADGKIHVNSTYNKGKKIVQLSLNNEYIKIWNSLYECHNNGYSRFAIMACCKHEPHRFSYKGFKWLYESEYNELVGSGQITEIFD